MRLFVLLFFLLDDPASLHPASVSGNPFGAGRRWRGERQIDQIDALPLAAALTDGFDAAVIIDLDLPLRRPQRRESA
jgi:hypothetical protein